MDNKLLLAVNFSAIDKLSPALKNIMGGAKGSAAMLSAMKKEASKAEAELKGVRKEIAGAVASGAGLQSLVNRERELAQQARLANAQFDKQQRHMQRIGTIQRRAGKVKDVASGVGTASTAFVTLPLAAFGMAAGKAAMDAEELQSAFNVTFAANTDAMNRWAIETGNSMGRAGVEIKKAANTFGIFFNQVATPQKAALMSQNFSVLAQDLGSFFNTDTQTAIDKLRSGLSGESEPLRDFGVFLTEAAVKAKAVKIGLIGVGGTMTEQQKIQARYALILEQTSKAQGDVLRTSKSSANQLRASQAAWENMQIVVGQKLLPLLPPLLEAFTNLITRFASLSPKMQKFIVLGGIGAALLGPILLGFAGLAGAVVTLAPALALLTSGFRIAGQAVLWLGRALMMNPIGLLVTAIAVAAYLIYTNWDTIKAAFSAGWAAIKAGAQAGWAWITSSFNTGIAWLSSLPSRFLAFGQNMMSGLINGISNGAQWVKDKIFGIAASIGTWFKSALGIKSPSRVFMGFGNYLTQGLALGIDDGAKGPMRSLARLTTGLAAGGALAVSGPVLAARGGPSGAPASNRAASAAPAPSGPITINVYGAQGQDVRMLAREVAKHIEGRDGVSGRSAYIDV